MYHNGLSFTGKKANTEGQKLVDFNPGRAVDFVRCFASGYFWFGILKFTFLKLTELEDKIVVQEAESKWSHIAPFSFCGSNFKTRQVTF